MCDPVAAPEDRENKPTSPGGDQLRILRNFSDRIGRRGGALFFVGVLDLVFATNLRILHNPATTKVYGSIIPLDV